MEKINDRLLNWASILEDTTREQAERTASMPFIYPHVALMPDAHLGMGATVGSVIPTHGAIIPAAVGVDIGCGMIAVRTQFTAGDVAGRNLDVLHEQISRSIPLSAGRYNKSVRETAPPRVEELRAMPGVGQADDVAKNWPLQLGSLGAGNHFAELSLDEADRVWLFLHSGSRGVGNKLAQKHITVAREQCRQRQIELPDRDLAYLVEGEPEFDAYLEALRWAQRFAYLNREEMMDRCVDQLGRFVGTEVERHETINCHHNYTERETHYGREVWLSRKGAISAREDQPGLIPGSMGAASYVVSGKGNVPSLMSSPHGAGRNFSRSAARKRFTRKDLDERMTGIAWGRSDAFLDEHPDAYKPIDQVMADAADLVEIRHTLRQIVNVKGD
ncbi:RtcB family protein [Blastococcus sp. CCUG 61487]|uniref:RtcB family protein n=1 Tax=Blastococcus sp. CCUG 61487 TaxID=1840703 RepID=UPI0010C015CE|nr:RtcB family protein [Blastococcus sp. CCUG 61487]TKJ28359.1 RNA-splicing ligase RtcB [Blastococcus sp. CCUG 61487]